MGEHLNAIFRCAADPGNMLEVIWARDGDLHLATYRGDGSYNAEIRLRAYHGGGHNTLLRTILNGLVRENAADPRQHDMLAMMQDGVVTKGSRDFMFCCDDNPGSHLKIGITQNALCFQTNCHDEERDHAAGGYGSRQGSGADVWLPEYTVPDVYRKLTSCLVDGKNPDPLLYDPPFTFLKCEPSHV